MAYRGGLFLQGNIMSSAIKEQITNDMKSAMKAQEKEKLGVIRLILAALKQREVDERITLEDSDVLAILQTYLPAQLPDTEVADLVKAAVASTGANSIKDMGKVMAILKPQLQGRADMSKVGELIKSLLP